MNYSRKRAIIIAFASVTLCVIAYIVFMNRPLPPLTASHITQAESSGQAYGRTNPPPPYGIRANAAIASAASITAKTEVQIHLVTPLMAANTCLGISTYDDAAVDGTAVTIGESERVHVMPNPNLVTKANAFGSKLAGVHGSYYAVVTDDGYFGYVCADELEGLVVIPSSQPVASPRTHE